MINSQTLFVPAWWDPKRRKMIFQPSTIVCGILISEPNGLIFLSERGVEFSIPRLRYSLQWYALRTACDIGTHQGKFRVYFSRPVKGVPTLGKSTLERIAGQLERLQRAGNVIGGLDDTISDVGDAAGFLGDVLAAGSAVLGLYSGYKNMTVLKQHLSGPVCQ